MKQDDDGLVGIVGILIIVVIFLYFVTVVGMDNTILLFALIISVIIGVVVIKIVGRNRL